MKMAAGGPGSDVLRQRDRWPLQPSNVMTVAQNSVVVAWNFPCNNLKGT
jgi:hypothetical protein